MAEVAGLVLGALPLAILALEKYAEPFEFLNKYRTAIESQKDSLILQNELFRASLAAIGLSDDSSEEQLIRCLERKYPDISAHIISVIRRMNATMTEFLRDIDIDINADRDSLEKRVRWEWRRVKRSCNAKKHRHLIDDLRASNQDLKNVLESKTELPAEDDSPRVRELKKRFNLERCDSIRQSLDSLHRALESRLDCFCSTHKAAIDLDWANFETKTAKCFQLALSYNDGPQPVEPQNVWRKFHVTNATVHEGLGDHQELKTQSQSSSKPGGNWRNTSLTSKLEGFKNRHRVVRWSPSVQPSQVPSTGTIPANTKVCSHPTMMEQKAEQKQNVNIALCPTVFHNGDLHSPVPDFSIRDPDPRNGDHFQQFSLKPSFPHASCEAKYLQALPIQSILSSPILSSPQNEQFWRQNPQGHPAPRVTLSAKHRYAIAASLTWSVLHLGGTSWLNENNNNNNNGSSRALQSYTRVVFLETTESGDENIMQHPSACCTLTTRKASAPPPPPEATTSTSLRVADHNLIRNRTLFDLGVLLIELAFDTPFTELQDRYYKDQPSSSCIPGKTVPLANGKSVSGSGGTPEQEVSDYAVARHWANKLYNQIGNSYAYAAERCILCSFPGSEEHRNLRREEFRRLFYNEVVAPVLATYMMFLS